MLSAKGKLKKQCRWAWNWTGTRWCPVVCGWVLNLEMSIGRQSVLHKCYTFCKGKGKVHSCTGTEALYRPYEP